VAKKYRFLNITDVAQVLAADWYVGGAVRVAVAVVDDTNAPGGVWHQHQGAASSWD
jgi:hypothetical protein